MTGKRFEPVAAGRGWTGVPSLWRHVGWWTLLAFTLKGVVTTALIVTALVATIS